MKLILHIMIALNVLSFGWFSYKASFSEAGKGEFQVASMGVKMLRLLDEREYIKDVSAHVQNQTESVSMCHTIGPFKNHDVARELVTELKEFGREGNIRTNERKVKYSYWVYLKSMPGAELDKSIAKLEANGVEDYHRNGRNELSLGMYSGIKSATKRQKNIAALGFSPLVGPLYRTEPQYWVDVTDTNPSMLTNEAWDSYLTGIPDNQLTSTKCNFIKT
jgi:hypothetical protein